MKVGAFIAALVVAAALAGCADTPAKPCPSTGCPTSGTPPTGQNPSTTPPQTTGGPVNVTLPYFVFEECRGLGSSVDIPNEVARKYIPEDFFLSGGTPATTLFMFNGFECDRAVHGNTTLNDLRVLWTFARIEPKESKWDADGRHYYLFDAFVSDAGVSTAMSAYGLPVKQATFSIDTTDVAGQGAVEQWSVEGPTLGIEFTHKHGSSQLNGVDESWHFWLGSGPYDRLTLRHQDKVYGPSAADVDATRITGSSPFHEAVGDANTFTGTPMESLSWTIDSAIERFSK